MKKAKITHHKSKTIIGITCLALLLAVCWLAKTSRAPSRYAGSRSCRECHADFYERWETSHHGKAMQPVTPALLRGLTPPDAPVTVSNRTYTVDLRRGRVTEAPSASYPMRHALGGKNVLYFLTPLDKGRLQVLPVAYDVRAATWFSTTDSAVRHFAPSDAPLDWRDPMLTFNTACFGCHVSQLEKNYDPLRNTYRTTWREPGISCETCHGPSAEHARAARKGSAMPDPRLTSWRAFTPAQVNSACATCHAKMYPLTPAFTPGDDFSDHYGLVTLEDPDFTPDGRDLGENYTYTLWLLNPCAQRGGLSCTHCHTSSGRNRFAPTGDKASPNSELLPSAACATCHPRDLTAHSRHTATNSTLHPPPSTLPTCISCHMPQTAFAAMRRSDHSHRPPNPEAAQRFGAASACTLCHTGKDEAWAAAHVRKWHPDDTRRAKALRQGDLIAAARKRDWERLPDILAHLAEPAPEPVIAASLLRLLRNAPLTPQQWTTIRSCATLPERTHLDIGHSVLDIGHSLSPSASPLVRSAAAALLGDNLRDNATAAALCRALTDPSRLVRVHAAQALAPYPRTALPADTLQHLLAAEAELLAMYNARPDDWASHYNTGNHRLARGDAKGAMAAYHESMRLRDDTVMPHVNAAILASQSGRLDEAIGYLRTALRAAPRNGAANLNLGLALAETGDTAQAEAHLRTALADPDCRAQAAYNLAVLIGPRDPAAAADLCRTALELEPGNPRYQEALEYFKSGIRN